MNLVEHNSHADSLGEEEEEVEAWAVKLLGLLLLLDMKLFMVDDVFINDWVRLLKEFMGNPKPKLDVVPGVDLDEKNSRVVPIIKEEEATFDHEQMIFRCKRKKTETLSL